MMALLDSSLRLSLVVGVALLVASALRGRPASLRHTSLAGGLLLAALVAPLSWVLPGWSVGLPAWSVGAGTASGFVETSLRGVTVSPASAAATTSVVVMSLWIAGTAVSLATVLVALASLRRISHDAEPVEEGSWREVADEIVSEMRLRRPVLLIEAPHQPLVATWGIRRPRVVIPSAAADWPREHIRAVLRHEMAHVARFDWPVQIAAHVLCASQWFNPLCWTALRRLRELSEMACDDEALRSGLGPSEYALRLVEITRASRSVSLPTAAVPMARPSNLERRIAAMLDSRTDRRVPSRWATAATFVALSLLVVPVAAIRTTQTAKPAEPVAPQAKSAPLKVGGAVKPPRKVHDVKVVYPEAMKAAGISGNLELEVTVGKDGMVRNVHVVTTDIHPDLAVAAVDAVRQWKFEPTLLNGAPVDVMMTCTIAFRLD